MSVLFEVGPVVLRALKVGVVPKLPVVKLLLLFLLVIIICLLLGFRAKAALVLVVLSVLLLLICIALPVGLFLLLCVRATSRFCAKEVALRVEVVTAGVVGGFLLLVKRRVELIKVLLA